MKIKVFLWVKLRLYLFMDPNTKCCSFLNNLFDNVFSRKRWRLNSKCQANICVSEQAESIYSDSPFLSTWTAEESGNENTCDRRPVKFSRREKKIHHIPVGHLRLFTVAVYANLNEPRLINLCVQLKVNMIEFLRDLSVSTISSGLSRWFSLETKSATASRIMENRTGLTPRRLLTINMLSCLSMALEVWYVFF